MRKILYLFNPTFLISKRLGLPLLMAWSSPHTDLLPSLGLFCIPDQIHFHHGVQLLVRKLWLSSILFVWLPPLLSDTSEFPSTYPCPGKTHQENDISGWNPSLRSNKEFYKKGHEAEVCLELTEERITIIIPVPQWQLYTHLDLLEILLPLQIYHNVFSWTKSVITRRCEVLSIHLKWICQNIITPLKWNWSEWCGDLTGYFILAPHVY